MNPAEPFRILLVEDNEDHAELIGEILADGPGPVEFLRCGDGAEALNLLSAARQAQPSRTPDLILLDLDMPNKNGFETLAEIKVDPVLRRIPVVILTTSRASSDVARALDGHANSYVCKTADFEALEELLNEVRAYWTDANLRTRSVLQPVAKA